MSRDWAAILLQPCFQGLSSLPPLNDNLSLLCLPLNDNLIVEGEAEKRDPENEVGIALPTELESPFGWSIARSAFSNMH